MCTERKFSKREEITFLIAEMLEYMSTANLIILVGRCITGNEIKLMSYAFRIDENISNF